MSEDDCSQAYADPKMRSRSSDFHITERNQVAEHEKTYTNIIKAMTGNKGVGMTDDEWHAIVKQNLQKEKEDKATKLKKA